MTGERINLFGRKLTAEETRMIFEGSVCVRPTQPKEEVSVGIPKQPTHTLPDLDPRYVAGCALVRRYGSPQEIGAMYGNQSEVRQINANTRAWMAEQQRRAA